MCAIFILIQFSNIYNKFEDIELVIILFLKLKKHFLLITELKKED